MGKFAATYDLPAGEQLLVVVHYGEDGPVMQLATEIHGQVVTAEIQLCDPGAFDDEQLAALHEARNNIDNFSEETVKDLRRRFTADFFGRDQDWNDPKSGGAKPWLN